ncbi:bifunctional salicylyl-CoA 5-hydroxylase/oxidoreductase [Deinococcus cavernae]|uniref:Bifunctional salicylyl-CoA 5-hydroxylase/oxidoreductase n=1 Tax=Deinococcus cavernae TaxID=2320857 RepID=A0A418UZY2_9DEIO|nr:bifunctional salicylyl-CoA 5-hydroxylase/oxidoreductase [Deinococcus cavernae]RJF69031.1 bifunctional salicylyl-CoA 5-hydroxylase/oxidoreductase [Deinococcus cavernae]
MSKPDQPANAAQPTPSPKTLILGGGPAGLYFGLLLKLARPDADVTILERNRAGDTFGWGVVFNDQTISNLMDADPVSAHTIYSEFNHWDDVEVHFKGTVTRAGGFGFIGIGRKRLLNILQDRCREVGVKLVFEHPFEDVEEEIARHQPDLVIAADGLNSRTRQKYAATYRPDIDVRHNRFVWLGVKHKYDAFTFDFQQTPHGWFQAHIYQFDAETSTFIVETPEHVWKAAGLEDMSQEDGIAYCEHLFQGILNGQKLLSNAAHLRGSAIWIKFPRVITKEWVHWEEFGARRVPIVLMGDAAHTAHYSIGSGTKLAFEDAISLVGHLKRKDFALEPALEAYVAERSVEVLKIQNAARNSTEWFEHVERYAALPPAQFAYSLLTRSQRISHENLRERDAEYLGGVESWVAEQSGLPAPDKTGKPLPPMLTPYTLRDVTLKNRIVMSPMAVYSAQGGLPNDFHLVHLGARALGGAGLIFTEMTCVLPEGRITPGCAGLWSDAQRDAWKRIVDFVHGQGAKVAIQLGHAGAKGSTRRAWDGTDLPLTDPAEPNWPLMSASEQQYLDGISQKSSAMTRADMETVKEAFVDATRRADEAGFDWLELHCAHGYLLSSFISPLTNRRTDEYGGSLEHRLRYPLEVFQAIRAVWPPEKPISVRISAHDWVEGGITPDDAVQIARLFKEAGADMIDCSSGQVSKKEQPVYGRMYQTPFADRIRNEAGIPTIAVGNIYEADHVNSIISSGRADLCAIARPHLSNPFWTLHETAKLGFAAQDWPKPYWAGQQQLERNLEREKQMQQAQAGADAALARMKAELEGSV